MKKYNGTLMQPHTDFKLKFIAQTSGGNVGEAFRLPARKYHEFPLLSGEIEPFFPAGRETRPLHPLSKQHDKLQFIVLARERPRLPCVKGAGKTGSSEPVLTEGLCSGCCVFAENQCEFVAACRNNPSVSLFG